MKKKKTIEICHKDSIVVPSYLNLLDCIYG